MNAVDVKCPICGTINKSLDLEETDGWMECESCGEVTQQMYQKRNEWMVDRSARIIAVYNGEPSGTGNTINYAKKVGVPAVYIQA